MISLEDVDDIDIFKQEVYVHQQLSNHESIITIIEYYIENNMLTIVTEYAQSNLCLQSFVYNIYMYIYGTASLYLNIFFLI